MFNESKNWKTVKNHLVSCEPKKKKVVCSLSCAGLKSAKGNLDCLKSHSLTPRALNMGGKKIILHAYFYENIT